MTTTYPRAEAFAKKPPLSAFTAPCSVTLELYGYRRWVLDYTAAEQLCRRNGLRGHEIDAAIAVFEERIDAAFRAV